MGIDPNMDSLSCRSINAIRIPRSGTWKAVVAAVAGIPPIAGNCRNAFSKSDAPDSGGVTFVPVVSPPGIVDCFARSFSPFLKSMRRAATTKTVTVTTPADKYIQVGRLPCFSCCLRCEEPFPPLDCKGAFDAGFPSNSSTRSTSWSNSRCGVPGRQSCRSAPFNKPESQRCIYGFEKHRDQDSTSFCLRGFVPDPLGGRRNGGPKDDCATGFAERPFDHLIIGFAQRNLSVPPDRPAPRAQSARKLFCSIPILRSVTDKNFRHR